MHFFIRPLKPGMKRAYWKCRCGQHLWDDFMELYPGAVKSYEELLNGTVTVRPSGYRRSTSPTEPWQQNSSSYPDSLAVASNHPELSELRLPRPTSSLAPLAAPLEHQTIQTNLLFLLITIKEGGGNTAFCLRQPSIHTLCSDIEFFTFLNKSYWEHRGKFKSLFSLRVVKNIKFVRLEVSVKGFVGILKVDDMPPESKVTEYSFTPIPAEIVPPIGENDLMHLFYHPDHADEGCSWRLSRFPKKLHEQLHASPEGDPGMGWGIVFLEDWHIKKIWIMGLVITGLGSALFGILWSHFEHSIQDAFSISSYIVAFVTLAIGTAQAVLHLN